MLLPATVVLLVLRQLGLNELRARSRGNMPPLIQRAAVRTVRTSISSFTGFG
jgi:hypothetical protein